MTIVKCHPLADGLLATVGHDNLVKVSCLSLVIMLMSLVISDLAAK